MKRIFFYSLLLFAFSSFTMQPDDVEETAEVIFSVIDRLFAENQGHQAPVLESEISIQGRPGLWRRVRYGGRTILRAADQTARNYERQQEGNEFVQRQSPKLDRKQKRKKSSKSKEKLKHARRQVQNFFKPKIEEKTFVASITEDQKIFLNWLSRQTHYPAKDILNTKVKNPRKLFGHIIKGNEQIDGKVAEVLARLFSQSVFPAFPYDSISQIEEITGLSYEQIYDTKLDNSNVPFGEIIAATYGWESFTLKSIFIKKYIHKHTVSIIKDILPLDQATVEADPIITPYNFHKPRLFNYRQFNPDSIRQIREQFYNSYFGKEQNLSPSGLPVFPEEGASDKLVRNCKIATYIARKKATEQWVLKSNLAQAAKRKSYISGGFLVVNSILSAIGLYTLKSMMHDEETSNTKLIFGLSVTTMSSVLAFKTAKDTVSNYKGYKEAKQATNKLEQFTAGIYTIFKKLFADSRCPTCLDKLEEVDLSQNSLEQLRCCQNFICGNHLQTLYAQEKVCPLCADPNP